MDKEAAFETMKLVLDKVGITQESNEELYNFVKEMFCAGFYYGYNDAVKLLNQFTINQQDALDLEFGLNQSNYTQK
ncbi:MAG: hypothetical protein WC449_05155 [Candidatus Paceibacterota bacterium]